VALVAALLLLVGVGAAATAADAAVARRPSSARAAGRPMSDLTAPSKTVRVTRLAGLTRPQGLGMAPRGGRRRPAEHACDLDAATHVARPRVLGVDLRGRMEPVLHVGAPSARSRSSACTNWQGAKRIRDPGP
jgi:hypothetical protein